MLFKKVTIIPVSLLAIMIALTAFVSSVRAQDFEVVGPGGAGGMYSPTFSPYTPGLILLGTDMMGAFRSVDDGKSWRLIDWRNRLRYMQFSSDPAIFPDKMYWCGKGRILFRSRDQGVTWEELTPVPWGKNKINQFVALPGKPDVLLVSTKDGVYRTQDDAGHWEKVSKIMFKGITEHDSVLYAVDIMARFRVSKDRGLTWSDDGIQVGGESVPPHTIAVFSGGGQDKPLLIAALRGGSVIRSLDRGNTWEKVWDLGYEPTMLVMPKTKDGVAYLARSGSSHNQLFKTEDFGETWKSVFNYTPSWKKLFRPDNVEPSWVQTKLGWNYVISHNGFAIDPNDPSHLILTTQGDIYETRNGGKSWVPIMNRHVVVGGEEAYQSIGLEVTSGMQYYIDPHDHSRHFATYSDIGVVRSPDGGKSWMWSGKGSPWTNTFYQIQFDPDTPGLMWGAATMRHDIPHGTVISKTYKELRRHQGGVVMSTDGGKSWAVPYTIDSSNGLPALACTTVAVDPNSPKENRVLYAGLFGEGGGDGAGVYKSEDGGKTWSKKSDGLGVAPNYHIWKIWVHPGNGNVYCLITGLRMKGYNYSVPGGLWKSTDGGESWSHISPDTNLNWHSTSMWVNPKDENNILVTATSPPRHWMEGGLYRTNDGGKHWEHILTDKDMENAVGFGRWDHTFAVAVHPNDPDLYYVGTAHHGLLLSRDAGKTWEGFESFPFQSINAIVVNEYNPEEMFVLTFGAGIWKGPYLPQ